MIKLETTTAYTVKEAAEMLHRSVGTVRNYIRSGELKAVQAIDDGYKKLLDECDALILKLRPDDPEPDEEEYERKRS